MTNPTPQALSEARNELTTPERKQWPEYKNGRKRAHRFEMPNGWFWGTPCGGEYKSDVCLYKPDGEYFGISVHYEMAKKLSTAMQGEGMGEALRKIRDYDQNLTGEENHDVITQMRHIAGDAIKESTGNE